MLFWLLSRAAAALQSLCLLRHYYGNARADQNKMAIQSQSMILAL